MPGFVNGHTHAAMTLFRGYADDLPLMTWLQNHIWPVEAKLDDDDVYWGTRLACVEMIRTGTVRFWDMYWQPGAVARAVGDAGVRATIGPPLLDGGDAGRIDELKQAAAVGLDEIAADGGELTAPSLAPHAIYTVSPESLTWIAARVRSGSASRSRSMLAETEQEVDDCLAAHGCRPIELLDRVGLLGPRTLLAHARLARRPRARADRRLRCHRRHQPGREHEARGRRRSSTCRRRSATACRSASAPTAPGRTTRST